MYHIKYQIYVENLWHCCEPLQQNVWPEWGGKLLTADDLTEQFLRCVSKEGGTAHQELIQDDAHRPPVHRLPVALTQDHLRGDVLWSAAHLEGQQNTKAICNELF